MTVSIHAQPDRRLVCLHISPTEAMAPRGVIHFVRRLNRFLTGSGLHALSQGCERIWLVGLKGPITAQDTGLVMLWLWRQPQVGALGIHDPNSAEVAAIATLIRAAR